MFVKRLTKPNSLAIIPDAGIVIGRGPSSEEQAATSVALEAAVATSTPTVTPTLTPDPTFKYSVARQPFLSKLCLRGEKVER